AGAVLAQEQQPVRLVAVLLVGYPNVAADDGFDARLTRCLIELDQAEDIGEVGEGKRGHVVCRCALDGMVQTDQPVGDRVFAGQPEVDEPGSHGRILRRPRFRCGPARNAPSRRPLPPLALETPAWRGSPSGAYMRGVCSQLK